MKNPFTLARETKMQNKVGKTAAKLGFVPVSGHVSPPYEHLLSEFGNMLERLMSTPEYQEIKKRRLNEEITAAEAWKLTGELAQKLQKKQ
ncbi:hypothetical protein GF391_01475 [Candidatus Uhrbacteria bacterium]|nr:hypothetical protein [Candidatus Uhrbacteria bacterium]